MPVLDFPASPITGDKYPVTAVPGQPQYTYDGVKWTTIGAQISNAAPATALPLMDAATAVVGTATKYAREDHVHPRFPAAPVDALGWSGIQINGSMEVSQQFGYDNPQAITTSTAPSLNAVCDGWSAYRGGTMMGNAYVATGGGTIFPGFANCLILTVTTAQASLGAGDFQSVYQLIEGRRITRLAWGTANAQPLTIGFWVAHARAGTYTGSVRSTTAPSRSCTFSYAQNVAGVAEFKTVTIPGCTDGTWPTDNTGALVIGFVMAAGSTYLAPSNGVWYSAFYLGGPGQVNAVAATSDIFRITGVVVLPGIAAPTAAQSPLIMRPYDQELVTCQRYYQKSTDKRWQGVLPSSGPVFNTHSFLTGMRATPTVVISPAAYPTDNNCGTINPSNATPDGFCAFFIAPSGTYFTRFDYTADIRL